MALTTTSSGALAFASSSPVRRCAADVCFRTPSPRAANAACSGPGPARSCNSAGAARGSSMRCSAYATGHHVRDRAIGLQHRGGERLVRLEPNQGEQRELEGFRLRCGWPWSRRPASSPRRARSARTRRRAFRWPAPRRLRPPCPALPLRARARAAPCPRGRASARLPPMRRRSGPARTRPSRARPDRRRQASPKALRSRPEVRRGRWRGPRGGGSAVRCPSRERSDRAAVAEAAVEAGA